jgi:hypothetical protein
MKIVLRGILRHPKGHARVRYDLVSTNYAMLMAESSSFNLKARCTRVVYAVDFSGRGTPVG